MKAVSLSCPQCNASIEVKPEQKQCFCSYCGTQLFIDDGSTTITHRTIDEAKIREIELNKEIKLKEMELEKEKQKNSQKFSLICFILWVVSVIILSVLSVVTLDEVNFSPYQLVLILDIVLGVVVILKKRKSFTNKK